MWNERVLTAAMVAMSVAPAVAGVPQTSATPIAGAQAAPAASAPAAASATPYGRLFQVSPPVAANRVAPRFGRAGTVPAPPRVVCGLTLIPGNSDIDRGIAAPIKPGETRFAIRSAEPSICR